MNKKAAIALGYEFHGAAVSAYRYADNSNDFAGEGAKDYIRGVVNKIKDAGYKAVIVHATANECGGCPFVEVYVDPKYRWAESKAEKEDVLRTHLKKREKAIADFIAEYDGDTAAVSAMIAEYDRVLAGRANL